ncbi:MAG: response regulator [Magnetococcus sp. DMHC-1]
MPEDQPKSRILIVDDIPANLFSLRQLLAGVDAEVMEAESGREALLLCLKHDFALVLLDVNMPEMDGFEVAENLHGSSQTRSIPIIFITAYYSDELYQVKGYESGAVDYITKPINDRILLSKVKIFLELHDHRRTLAIQAKILDARNQELQKEILIRKQAESFLKESAQSRATRQLLLQTLLEPMTLAQQLQRSLEIILNIPWLAILAKGSIFLVDTKTGNLVMTAQCNLAEYLLTACARISPGFCLCGKASQTKEIVFATQIDDRHDVRYDDMEPHGHYCVPILQGDTLLGVLNLYVEEGYRRESLHDLLLSDISQTLAGIIDRRQMDDVLQRAKRDAENANHAKSIFLANMSHEIRTPMNAVIGLADLALQMEVTPKLRDYLVKISKSSQSLLRIINDILDFSKIEEGKLELEMADFFLRDVFDHLIDLFRARITEKNLELIMSVSEGFHFELQGDFLRLEQVLLNLIGNAIKFTDEGEIEVGVHTVLESESDLTLEFCIRDTGIGMTEEQVSKLFQAFSQADNTITRKYGGSGLGLSISKKLVEMMGGKIWATSQPGQGSQFYFTARFLRHANPGHETMHAPEGMAGLKVLIVDDNKSARSAMLKVIGMFNFAGTAVDSGQEAIEIIKQNVDAGTPFQLVLMDWLMPEMDGIQTIRKIKTRVPKKHFPKTILMIPCDREEKLRKTGQAEGVHAHLLKPVNCSILFDTIMTLFGHEVTRAYRQGSQVIDTKNILERIGGARVLLVEDNAINRQVAGEILANIGLVVDVAHDGKEALAKVMEADYDIVLMDIQMPVMDGYNATHQIRNNEKFKDLPIIAMTAHAMKGDREKSIRAGMNDHVSKPINRTRLYATLVKWIPPRAGLGLVAVPERTPESEQAGPDIPDHLPGLDVNAALERLNGNRRLFQSLLFEFHRDYAQSDQTIRTLLTSNNPDDAQSAARIVHTVKGMAGNIAAQDLFATAVALEKAMASEKNNLPQMLDLFSRTLAEVVNTIGELQRQVKAKEAAKNVAEAGSTKPLQMDVIIPLMAELSQLLRLHAFETLRTFDRLKPLLNGASADVQKELMRMAEQIEKIDFKSARQTQTIIANLLAIPEDTLAHGQPETSSLS